MGWRVCAQKVEMSAAERSELARLRELTQHNEVQRQRLYALSALEQLARQCEGGVLLRLQNGERDVVVTHIEAEFREGSNLPDDQWVMVWSWSAQMNRWMANAGERTVIWWFLKE